MLFASIDIDQHYSNHVEYDSGLLLFRTCLFLWQFATTPEDLVNRVDNSLPPLEMNKSWKLQEMVFNAWKQNSGVILAAIHDLRLNGRTVSNQVLRDKLSNIFKAMEPDAFFREYRFDECNRVVWNRS